MFIERIEALCALRAAIIEARVADKAKRLQNKQFRYDKLLKNLQEVGGLWRTVAEVNMHLAKCRSKLAALKIQINACKSLLQQEADKSMFAFSSNRKPLSQKKLEENLCSLIIATSTSTSVPEVSFTLHPEELVGKNISHIWNDNLVDVTFFGRILKYNAKKRDFVVLYSSERERESA